MNTRKPIGKARIQATCLPHKKRIIPKVRKGIASIVIRGSIALVPSSTNKNPATRNVRPQLDPSLLAARSSFRWYHATRIAIGMTSLQYSWLRFGNQCFQAKTIIGSPAYRLTKQKKETSVAAVVKSKGAATGLCFAQA